jgi:hypothetical protein
MEGAENMHAGTRPAAANLVWWAPLHFYRLSETRSSAPICLAEARFSHSASAVASGIPGLAWRRTGPRLSGHKGPQDLSMKRRGDSFPAVVDYFLADSRRYRLDNICSSCTFLSLDLADMLSPRPRIARRPSRSVVALVRPVDEGPAYTT